MDFRDLVFLSVAENLSFSKAAKQLFISQPAITKHVKELENQLNIALFERTANKVYLTEAGKIAYNHLTKIKQNYNELEFELGRLNDTFAGILRVGASSTISQYLIPPIIASFHLKYPQIKLDIFSGNSSEMEEKLLKNQIDMALVENENSLPSLKYINIFDDEIIAVAGNKNLYAKNRSLTITDIQNIPIVLREKGSGTLEVIENALNKKGIELEKLNILIHLGSTEAIKNFLPEFDGIALVSKIAVEKELYTKQLLKINISNFIISRYFRMVFRYGPEQKISKLFSNFIANHNF